jgi:ribose transport system substrate-binding protein
VRADRSRQASEPPHTNEGSMSVTIPVRTKAAASLAAAVAIVLLAACSSGGGDGTASTADAGSDTTTSEGVAYAKTQLEKYSATRDTYGTPVPVANVPDLQGKTVWYVPIGTGVPVLATIGNEMGNALGKVGASVHTCDGKFQPTTIASCMSTAATQGASAVVTGFVDYASAPSAFQSLVSKGIPVLVGGEPVSGGATPGKNLGFFDPSGLTQQAFRLMSDAAIADSNGKANVLVVRLTDSSVTIKNNDVGIDELKQHCPKCKVTTVDTLTADMSKLGSAISAKLAANPDTDYLFLPQDAFLQAAMPGIQSAGFTNRLKVIAPGGTTAGLQALKAGQMAYNIGQGAVYNGWGFADATVRLLAGAEIQPENDGAVRVFTKDNVSGLDLSDANYNSTTWYGGDQWQQDFLTAWGVKQ